MFGWYVRANGVSAAANRQRRHSARESTAEALRRTLTSGDIFGIIRVDLSDDKNLYRKGVKAMIKQCENGHYYDADRFPICPFCGGKDMNAADDNDDVTVPLVNNAPPQNVLPTAAPTNDDDEATIPLAFYNKKPMTEVNAQPPAPVMPPMEQPSEDEKTIPMSVLPPMEQPPEDEKTMPMSVMPPMEQPTEAENTLQPPMPVMPQMEQPMAGADQPSVMPPMEQPTEAENTLQPPMPVMPQMEQPMAGADQQPVMSPMQQPMAGADQPSVMPLMQQPMQPPVQQYQPQPDFPYPPLIPMQQPVQPAPPPPPPMAQPPMGQPSMIPPPPPPPMMPPMQPPMPPAGNMYGYGQDDEPTISIAQAKSGSEPVVGWILGMNGATMGKSFELKAGKNFIGRAPGNDIVIPDDNSVAMNHHASVLYEPRERVFIALPSEGKELLYVNDELLVKSRQLEPYDRLKAGETNLLFFPLCTSRFAWEDLEEE